MTSTFQFIKNDLPSHWEDLAWHNDEMALFWNEKGRVGVFVNRKPGDRDEDLPHWLYVIPDLLKGEDAQINDTAKALYAGNDENKALEAIENYLKTHP